MGIKIDEKTLTNKNKEAIKESKKAEKKDDKRDDGTYTWRPFANLKSKFAEKK